MRDNHFYKFPFGRTCTEILRWLLGKRKVRKLKSFDFHTNSEFDEKITFCILTPYKAYRKDHILVKKEFFFFLVVETLSARRGTNCLKLTPSMFMGANMKKFKELFFRHFIIIIIIPTRGGTSMVVFEIWKSGCYRDGKAPKCIIFSKCWWLSNDFEITPKPYVFVFGSQTQTMVSCEHFHATKNRLRQTNCEENLLSKKFLRAFKEIWPFLYK